MIPVHDRNIVRHLARLVAEIGALALAAGAAPAQSAPVLYTYDLTRTVELDRNDGEVVRRAWDETHFVSSVQGIVNRRAPRLYLFLVGDASGRFDRFWLDVMREPGGWLTGHTLQPVQTPEELVRTFRGSVKGLVVYDENVPATSNVASTVAGVESVACVRFDRKPGSFYHRLAVNPSGPKLPVRVWLINKDGTPLFTGRGTIPGSRTASTGSAKCDAYIWAKERYLDTGRCNPEKMAYYLDAYWLRHPQGYVPNHTLSNHDYFIAQKGFFFDLSPWGDETPVDDRSQPLGADEATLKAILRSGYDRTGGGKMIHVGGFLPWGWKYNSYGAAGGKHEAVPGEWRYAEILSCFNAYMDADALGLSAMANASVYSRFPLAAQYKQKKPTLDDLRTRGLVDEAGRVKPRSYVALYGGDYDSAAWLYWQLPDMWRDPARGQAPVGWAFNPNLADRFALGMHYARTRAIEGDIFIAGDNGAGYVNPSRLVEPRVHSGLPSGIKVWEEHCSRYYRRWDLSLTGFLIDGYAPPSAGKVLDAYSRFSPDGVVGQKVPHETIHGNMPLLRMEWDIYDVGAGADVIVTRSRADQPQFSVYRTILWSPTKLKALTDRVKADPRGRDIEFVDPHTLMLLVKQHLTGPDQGRKRQPPPLKLGADERANRWDVRTGVTVTGHSDLVRGCDPRDMFGGVFGSIESRDLVLFGDGKPDGYAHWVEWRTAAPIRLERIEIYAEGDGGATNREAAEIRLMARAADGAWKPIAGFTPDHPYRHQNRAARMLRAFDLTEVVVASEFRAEFVQRTMPGATPMGPRVAEIAGIGMLADPKAE